MSNAGAPDRKEKALADGQAQAGAQRRGGKSDAAFRTISEVASELDVPQHVLRFWETKFSQIRPMKRGGGRRYYRPEDVILLTTIRDLLYREGYTIKGVQKLLRDNGAKAVVNALQDRTEEDTSALALVGMAASHDGPGHDGGPAAGAAPVVQAESGGGVHDGLHDGDEAFDALEADPDADSTAEGVDPFDDDDMASSMADAAPSWGLGDDQRQELEAILDELVALRSLMGQALENTRAPSAPTAP